MKKLKYLFLSIITVIIVFIIYILYPVNYIYHENINNLISNEEKAGIFKVINLKENSNYKNGFAQGTFLKEDIINMNNDVEEILKNKNIDSLF